MFGKCKRCIACVLYTAVLSTSAFATEDPWFGEDKAKHVGYSALVGAASSWVALEEDASDLEAVAVGLAIVIPFGVAKESYDLNVKKTFWSWKDITWNVFGSIVGSLLAIAAD